MVFFFAAIRRFNRQAWASETDKEPEMPTTQPKRPNSKPAATQNDSGAQAPDNPRNSSEEAQAGQYQGFSFYFDDIVIRAATQRNDPIFMVASVCRALGLGAKKGSYAHHLNKLENHQKIKVSRSIFLSDTPLLKGGVVAEPKNGSVVFGIDHETLEEGSEVWAVTESGLYILIMRNQKATTPGTAANRFLRWVTDDVLPTIRKTGSYTTGAPNLLDNQEKFSLNLSDPGRYVIMVVPGSAPRIRKTQFDALLDEWSALDTEILVNQIRTVDAMWQKTQLVRSAGDDPAGSPLYDRFGASIAEARRMAEEYMRAINVRPK